MLRDEIKNLIRSGRFAIVAGDPVTRNGKPYTLDSALRDGWYTFVPAVGVWNGIQETSYIVRGMDSIGALLYGRWYAQTCVIADNAIMYCDATVPLEPLDCANTTFYDNELPDGNYTQVVCDDGGYVAFTIPALDLSNMSVRDRLREYAERGYGRQ